MRVLDQLPEKWTCVHYKQFLEVFRARKWIPHLLYIFSFSTNDWQVTSWHPWFVVPEALQSWSPYFLRLSGNGQEITEQCFYYSSWKDGLFRRFDLKSYYLEGGKALPWRGSWLSGYVHDKWWASHHLRPSSPTLRSYSLAREPVWSMNESTLDEHVKINP